MKRTVVILCVLMLLVVLIIAGCTPVLIDEALPHY
jgi:hypothetical protein